MFLACHRLATFPFAPNLVRPSLCAFPRTTTHGAGGFSTGVTMKETFPESVIPDKTSKRGKANSPNFDRWLNMISRCYNPKHKSFSRYGARGIRVSSEWMVFDNFNSDMGVCPSKRHTLDRIDNSLHYCKSNCRWATWETQNRNRTDNVVIVVHGEAIRIADYCSKHGLNPSTFYSRIRRGHSEDRMMEKPRFRSKKI